jgi:hypothetical protein
MFDKIRQDQDAKSRTVFIAGAYEFLADDGEDAPDPKAWPALAKGFASLDYSAGALSPEEAKALQDQGLKMPPAWVALDNKKVQSTILTVAGGKIGVLFFPVLAKPGASVDEGLVHLIEQEAQKLKPQVNLVVGVSPWGVQNESDFLDKVKPGLDVLLGSGPGVGFSAKPSPNGKVLWMHTYTKGKAIYTVDLPAWPTDKDFQWTLDGNYSTKAVLLDDSFQTDPGMVDIFQGIPDPNDKHK